MSSRATLVFTTIFDATVLDGYYANFKKFGHLDAVDVIVIPDRKTPESMAARCRDLSAKGLKAVCPSLTEQEEYLKKLGLPANFIPYDSDNRRNVGYLMALEGGSDFLISIDDDNFSREEDCFTEHAVVVAGAREQEVTASATGYLNICELLELEKPRPVYARGFPYEARHKDEAWSAARGKADVHLNAGLWLKDPDIDGITWLVAMPKVKAFRGKSLVLSDKTWSPINTQNTGLRSDAIAAYYFIKMGYPLGGLPIDRYGDIFSGYFVQACVKHLGGAVRVGTPVADHIRNRHSYMRDATGEWACICLLEDLVPWLREAKLTGKSYIDTYESLSYLMEDAVEQFRTPFWTDASRAYFHQMAYCMRLWLKACRQITGK